MIYRIHILKNAKEDLDWFSKNDRKSYCKCFDLVRELMENPRKGLGKPERLKYFDKEVYSRRINLEDRLIYTIYEDIGEIDISSFRGHYIKPESLHGNKLPCYYGLSLRDNKVL